MITAAALPPAERRGGTLAGRPRRAVATVLAVLIVHAGLLLGLGRAMAPGPAEPGPAPGVAASLPPRLSVRTLAAADGGGRPAAAASPLVLPSPGEPAPPGRARPPARALTPAEASGAGPRQASSTNGAPNAVINAAIHAVIHADINAAAEPAAEPAITRLDPTPAATTAAEPALARLAPPFSAVYHWQQDGAEGRATLVLALDASRYTLALHRQRQGQPTLHGISRGQTGAHGLAPERHVEGQGGRDRRAINFVREGGGRILASDHAGAQPLPAGVQDPVSWLVQLAGLLEADAALRQPGAVVALWMAGPRGQLEAWALTVIGPEAGTGGRPLLKLARPAARPWDVALEVWLDPAERHLPHTVAWRREDGLRQAPLQRLALKSLTWDGPGS